MNLADIRQNYLRGELHRADLAADPVEQFQRWMAEATEAGVVEPTAMSLATSGADGAPRVRTVLLKGLDERGFVFYTNRESRKGDALAGNGRAALLFPWLALERQVLVAGRTEPVGDEETRRYFESRPYESRLAAWTSRQSRPVASRTALEAELAAIRARFGASEGGERGARAPVLGRLPRAAGNHRVLAGPREPAARPLRIHPATGRRLDPGTARTVKGGR